MADKFQKIFDKNQFFLDDIRNKSTSWYNREVDKLIPQRITNNKLIKDNANHTVSKIQVGSLYLYEYDPKYKEELPFYDRYPMVFPFSPTKTGFIGLNMHYLPYDARIKLFDALYNLKSSTMITENTKLKLSWEAIQNLSKFPLAQPCVKQYLYSHIRSSLVKVEAVHWATAMMIVSPKFVKQNNFYVWGNSIKR